MAFDCCQIDPEARPSAFGGEGDMRADMESLLREVRLYPDRRKRKKTSMSSIFSTKGKSRLFFFATLNCMNPTGQQFL